MGWDDKGRMSLRLVLEVPPTDNQIYINNGFGGRALSAKAKKFKRQAVAEVAKVAMRCDPDACFLPNVEYEVLLFLYLDRVETKGWAKGKTANRYKKVDTTNRQKLVIDGVMEGIGIDDCHIFKAVLHKRCSPDNPRLVIIVREREARHE